jgi:tRNA-2-methylthio-N6-dimethylallyladenosine synthase
VKKERLAQVQQVIKQSSIDKTDAMLGKIERVLIEKVSDKDPNFSGTADNTRLVTFIGDAAWVGRLQRLRLLKLKL